LSSFSLYVFISIQVIKLYAWEIPFIKKITEMRKRETQTLKKFAFVTSNINVISTTCSLLNTFVTFTAYVYLDPENNLVTPEKIFPTLTLLQIISIPMFHIPKVLIELIKLDLSVKRMNAFLNCGEIAAIGAVKVVENEENAVEIKNADLTWNKETGLETLKGINLNVTKGSLVAVLGKIGSGKSSLLSTLLGELHVLSGRVGLSGSVALVQQQAWIQNMTLRDNILFGKDFDMKMYNSAVESCALEDDLEILPAGDMTEIGENGINLSGGQKQRVSVGRAVYNNADIVLLDDPLSAVDSNVAEHIFENVIEEGVGVLSGKTRILVTHNLTFLSKVDRVVLLDEGKIVADGTFAELKKTNEAFKNYIRHQSEELVENSEGHGEDKVKLVKRQRESRNAPKNNNQEVHKLISEEKTETGRVKWTHYIHYFRHANWFVITAIFLMYILGEAAEKAGTICLSYWANAAKDSGGILPFDEHNWYIMILGITVLVQCIMNYMKFYSLLYRLAEVSRKISTSALDHVMKSPISFFESNKSGTIVNRFSSDLDILDNKMPTTLLETTFCFMTVLGNMIIIASQAPYIMIFFIPICIAALMVQIFYSATKRQLKRIEAVNKSPIYTKFSESIQGTSTIRAYSQEDRFIKENSANVSRHLHCCYINEIAVRWLAIRTLYCGSFLILLTACFATYYRETLLTSMAALIVTYASTMMDHLNWTVRMTSELEADSVAIERLREYEHLKSEGEWFTQEMSDTQPLEETWPIDGSIKFDEYSTQYRPELSEVIRNLQVDVVSGEKLGICGRTGAGKSSLTLALFRILNASKGKIVISGRDIATIGLQELRSQVTIIPQDPVLFSGTIRFNLDPTGIFLDDSIWTALRLAHLSNIVSSFEAGLDQNVSEGGRNLSVGQRQCLCLARALLRKTKILVMDEATSAMDTTTDKLIQDTLSVEFADCTIVTIAHRLNTILNYDRIMVMGEGRVLECGAPINLLSDRSSQFFQLCEKAGLT
jgi:ATP-binding cassette subfamily C (CFTR/MRP) protein 1